MHRSSHACACAYVDHTCPILMKPDPNQQIARSRTRHFESPICRVGTSHILSELLFGFAEQLITSQRILKDRENAS